jgi:hypothetical protein
MKASETAMMRGWGQSAHGTNFLFGKWRWLYAMLTGKRVLICANHNRVSNATIPLIYKFDGKTLEDFHGFWSDNAGALLWGTAVTREYVCTNPACVKYAEETNRRHDEYFSDPQHRAEVSRVMAQIGGVGPLNYDHTSYQMPNADAQAQPGGARRFNRRRPII